MSSADLAQRVVKVTMYKNESLIKAEFRINIFIAFQQMFMVIKSSSSSSSSNSSSGTSSSSIMIIN